ncbi:MAG TPA: SRPBCC family protein [Gammaproteobacteria bacterium]|nr:SRPBCC family protein [Gammaproteobacteria bacterium]
MHEVRHLSVSIACPPQRVYEYAADPANLAHWASGVGASIHQEDGRWLVDVPDGTQAEIRFTPRNSHGILDHEVILADGSVVPVPMRVVANGKGAEIIFTLFRLPGMSEAEVERDLATIREDLGRLKRILEEGR